jgi:hypothetical protein
VYKGIEQQFSDFSGGLHSSIPETSLSINEAADLDNIVVFSKGKGFRGRYGDTEFNSSAMVSESTPVTGLHVYVTDTRVPNMVAVAGTKVFKSDNMDGTMDDITGSLTISDGANNIWTLLTFNNRVLGFGGSPFSPDVPWSWGAADSTATALAGSPPSAYGAFQANNRIFAFRTAANPSRISWSILGNEADWTGTGSGHADVWTSDGDSLTAAAVLNHNTVLLFKENSVHQMQIGTIVSSAFPIYPLFTGVGCAGKHACVVHEGLAYFITPQGQMKITDGTRIIGQSDLPNLGNIDDLWEECNSARLPYVQGVAYKGIDFDAIIWTVSYGINQATNNRAFVWDITNKCWLQWSTGYKCSVLNTTFEGALYGGHYTGKILQKDIENKVTDDSESDAVIDGNWTSGWVNFGKFETIKQPRKLNLLYTLSGESNLRLSYGFDFSGLDKSFLLPQSGTVSFLWDDAAALWDTALWFGPLFTLKGTRLAGRGNFFKYKIQTPTAAAKTEIHGFTVSGKEYGQKELTGD